MKHRNSFSPFLLTASLTLVGLTGCAGIPSNAFPDPGSPTTSLGTIKGSNFGGHAPLVGAHVYVLQASTSGYGAASTSLLGASYAGTSYPTTENISDPYIPTATPWYYVTTDSTGGFTISGDYICTSGLPVYLYAYGGSPTTTFSTAAISSFKSITASAVGSTLQFTTNVAATSGEQIILSGFSAPYTYLNGQSGTVLAVGLTSTTSTGGMLFNGSTFTPLNYVYVNEVSTVATAYAMAGFGTDGLHIGTDTATSPTLTAPGVIGIQNAAMNAGNLYDIQGKYISSSFNGEGHIANPTTFNGSQNGTVSQAVLDTLGNILATCVDSGNTYNPVTGTGVKNAACTGTAASATSPSLLLNASSNGGNTGGTAAPNTAAAAFNIAHNPMTANVVALYTLPTGTVPFTPHLTATPNDFTVGIIYAAAANATSGASATSTLTTPVGIAIDSYGDAYVPSTTGITKLGPLGNSLATTSTTLSTLDAIAIDQLGNVWATTIGGSVGSQSPSGALYEFTSDLASVSGSPFITSSLYAPTAIAIDSSNNLFMTEWNSIGGSDDIAYVSHSNYKSVTQLGKDNCFNQATSVVVGSADYAWIASSQNNNLCRVNSSTTFGFNGTGGSSQNFNFALDSGNDGWFGNHGQSNVYKTTPSGTTTAMGKSTVQNQTNNNIAGIYQPTWSAVDGSGNVYLQNDNGSNSSISEISNAGVALSCPTCLSQNSTPYYGYQPGNVGTLGAKLNGAEYPGGIAMDPSGDLWVANYSLNTVLEIIGIGTPVVTPLSSEKGGIAP